MNKSLSDMLTLIVAHKKKLFVDKHEKFNNTSTTPIRLCNWNLKTLERAERFRDIEIVKCNVCHRINVAISGGYWFNSCKCTPLFKRSNKIYSQ